MATNLTTLFTNIANAIRAKTGESAPIVAENFPTTIGDMWGIMRNERLTVASNTLTTEALKTNDAQFRAIIAMTGTLLDSGAETLVCLLIRKNKELDTISFPGWCTYNNGVFNTVKGTATLDTTTGTITLGGNLKFNAGIYSVIKA